MSIPAPRTVVSGKPYAVRRLAGQPPTDLHAFVGETRVVLDLDGDEYTICGPGVQDEGCVRLYEKCDEGAGKDVRVWIVQQADAQAPFTATAVGIDVPSLVNQASV